MESDYSIVSKVLHRMALGWPFMGEMTFDMERNLYLKSAPDPAPAKHVFVSGLARSGTTILMREIYGSGEFASVLYADMPFVLAPRTWSRMARRSSKEEPMKERAHRDGIMVNVDSPEALDEVFWRVFARDEYIKKDGLVPHMPDEDTLQQYGEYIRLILRHREKTRYLSKSCNSLLRLPALRRFFPDAVFLVPIRSPLTHAQSLLSQHQRFVDCDRFTRRYMEWLGHHEFGAGHRPFLWTSEPMQFRDPLTLDYWLEQWLRCYTYLRQWQEDESGGLYFIPYESLCERPEVWAQIAEVIEIPETGSHTFKKSDKPVEAQADETLLQSATALWEDMQSRALARLGCTA